MRPEAIPVGQKVHYTVKMRPRSYRFAKRHRSQRTDGLGLIVGSSSAHNGHKASRGVAL